MMDFSLITDLVAKVTHLRGSSRTFVPRYGTKRLLLMEKQRGVFGALRNEPTGVWEDCLRSKHCRKLLDATFVRGLAFVVDASLHLNHRSAAAACGEMYQDRTRALRASQRTLTLFRGGLSSVFPDLAHLAPPAERFLNVRNCFQSTEPRRGFEEERFQEFHTAQPRVAFLSGPFSDAVRATRGAAAGPVEWNERTRQTEESGSRRAEAQTPTLTFAVSCKSV